MNIQSGKLRIRNATVADAAILSSWWNDGKVMAHAGFPRGFGISETEAVALIRENDDRNRRLVIEFEDEPIGEMRYRTAEEKIAEIGIKICRADKQNQGYGSECLKMLMKYIFIEMQYDRIVLDTNLENERAQYVYEKLGFQRIRTHMNSWTNQVGESQSSVDYELLQDGYLKLYRWAA